MYNYLTVVNELSDMSKNTLSYLLVIVNKPAFPDRGFKTLSTEKIISPLV
jgi:hypothetical protein